MKFLLVAATVSEVKPLLKHFNLNRSGNILVGEKFDLLITGVGMVATAYALGTHFQKTSYRFALNAGVAGSFVAKFNLGDLVRIKVDCFSELGAEDGENFIPIEALGFGEGTIIPLNPALKLDLPQASGISVNTVHGNSATIEALQKRLNADVETMEGAAFFYACNKSEIPSLQIRAVSNYVEKRNRENWKISLAIENLNDFLIDFIASEK